MRRNKTILFTISSIIILIILIVTTSLLLSKDDKIECKINTLNSSSEKVLLEVSAIGSNTTIKTVDGIDTNQKSYKTTIYENGTYTFYVTDGKNENTCSININSIISTKHTGQIEISVDSVSINNTNINMKVGSTFNLIANILPNNATDQNINWSSSDTKIAEVDYHGKVIAKASGTATITAKTSNGKTATCMVKVEKEPTPIVSAIDVTDITITHDNKSVTSPISLSVNSQISLKAVIKPDNATNKSLSWTTSNANVATVDHNGNVTGKSSGTVTITVMADKKSASCTINVIATNTKKYAEIYFLNVYDKTNILNANNPTGYNIGQSIIIKTLDKKYILIDTGSKDSVIAKNIYNELKQKQNKTNVNIDYFIITHSHADHAGNAVTLLKNKSININKVIMKKESKSVTAYAYDKVLKQLKNADDMISIKNEGQKITLGKYLEIYLFNTKDVYKNKTCHEKGYYLDYTNSVVNASKINGKYYYFDGSTYPNIKIVETNQLVTKNGKINAGLNNYFYAYLSSDLTSDCNANTDSLAVVIKVKTENGNRYMYFPGDLDNSGYDLIPYNSYYGNGRKIIYPIIKNIKISNNTSLFSGYVNNLNRIPAETNTANNIKKVLGSDINNITIYQAAHHGLNNAPDAINILGLNKASVYTIIPIKTDIASTSAFTLLRTYYYTLAKSKKLYPGGTSKNGIYCSINEIGNTICSNY